MKQFLAKNNKHTLRGAASFYVVIFTTLLLSVITMSFIRIMISEATKTTNDDLSKSAYDSALAGIEDAKIALTKYHECIDQGYTAKNPTTNYCEHIIYLMENFPDDCDLVSLMLGRNNDEHGEVIVRESSSSRASTNMEQAYTCVKMSEELVDYRSQVSSSNRVRLVPLRAEDVSRITGVAFNWYSTAGRSNKTSDKFIDYATASSGYIPVVVVDIFQTDAAFRIGELSTNNNSKTGTDHSSLILQPTGGAGITKISSSDVLNASDKYDNSPIRVQCGNTYDFKCQSYIQFPQTFRNEGRNESTFLLRVELPYADEEADFSVQLCTGHSLDGLCNSTIEMDGVQAQIDSTGRANDLYRRLETRVELVDTNFPYPEFAIQSNGNTGETLSKNFWVTRNCWSSDIGGSVSSCPNSSDTVVGF